MSDSDLKFIKVAEVEPGKQDISLIIKVTRLEVTPWQTEKGENYQGQGGDETGVINFNLRGKHADVVKEGQVIILKRVNCQVYDSKMRLIDIHNQSNVSTSISTQISQVNTSNDVSQDEYELLPQEGEKQNRNRDRKRNNNTSGNSNNNNNSRNQGIRSNKSDNSFNRDRKDNDRSRNNDSRDYRDNDRPRYNDRRDGDNGRSRDRRDNNRDNDRPRTNDRRDNDRPRNNDSRDNDRPRYNDRRDGDNNRSRDRRDNNRDNDRPRTNDRRDNDRPRNNDRKDNDRSRNNDRRDNDKPKGERRRRSQSQRRRKERDINENDNTHYKQIKDLVPHPDDFVTVEAKIHTISEEDPKGIRGTLGDATGVVNFYIIKDAIPEGIELKQGDVIRIVEGKCKVYDEHAYISVAGGILRRAEGVTINVNESFDASKDVYGKITINDKGTEKQDRPPKQSSGNRNSSRNDRRDRSQSSKNRTGSGDERSNVTPGELKKPEFISISSIPKKRRAFNLRAKVISLETKDKRPRGQGNDTKAFVGRLADASGVFDFYFRADQLPKERSEINVGDILDIRNASQRQFKLDRRWYVYIDMFGKVTFSSESVDANEKGQDFSIDSRDN